MVTRTSCGSPWERDPFQLTEEDGFFFGRGTLDDKFGTSVLTATFLRLKGENTHPQTGERRLSSQKLRLLLVELSLGQHTAQTKLVELVEFISDQ